jgi:serine phosphatase RsbU (regulator of sigma subunit)
MVCRHRHEPVERLVRLVADEVAAWAGGSPQDDATLIAVAVT